MEINTYIESGVLELYVAGALSDAENKEVYDMILKHPEILKEVLDIENAVVKLTASTSTKISSHNFDAIKQKLGLNGDTTKVIAMKPKYNWITYTGWAATIVLGAGLLWTLNQNKELQSEVQTAEIEQSFLEKEIEDAKTDLAASKELLNVLRDREIISVPLGGQGNFANTYAEVYWDKKTNSIYLDAQGLPEPPEGKVYQVWSLTLSPLTPVSLGTIDDFATDENKIFKIENLNSSEAFGITLEPAGGSAAPTMEQLYTLGVVETAS
jgi:anti-sigma-K factor RskA